MGLYSPSLGPVWSEGEAICMIIRTYPSVLKIRDGRIVARNDSLNGEITVIERADINAAEGTEILVGLTNDTDERIVVLDATTLLAISEIVIGTVWQHLDSADYPFGDTHYWVSRSWWEGIRGINWLGGEDSTLLVFRETHSDTAEGEYQNYSEGRGTVSKFNLAGDQVGDSIACGVPIPSCWHNQLNGESGFLVGGNDVDIEWGDMNSGGNATTMVTAINADGDLINQRQLSYAQDWWWYDEARTWTYLSSMVFPVTPDSLMHGFVCVVQDSDYFDENRGEPSVIRRSTLYMMSPTTLETEAEIDLGNRTAKAMFSLPANAVAEDRLNLLILDGGGRIRLLDLESLTLNSQEYFWEAGSSAIYINDIDSNGIVELIGVNGTVLTFGRLNTLSVPVFPSILQPSTLSLSAFPNPFNSSTTINYSLPRSGRYAIDVIDIQGRLVTRLSDGWREAGSYREVLNGEGLASGQYMLKLEGASSSSATPVTIIR